MTLFDDWMRFTRGSGPQGKPPAPKGGVVGGYPGRSFHGYTAATRFRPEWIPAFLVFQGGDPHTKFASITGGGQIYGREFAAMGRNGGNVMYANSPGLVSVTGPGQIPYDPAFLQPLLGGKRGVGS